MVPTSPPGLYLGAFAFAKTHHQRGIYDVLYVVLAQELGTELWTADLALIVAIGSTAPWVRWIGDF